jgi:hypothetical protein
VVQNAIFKNRVPGIAGRIIDASQLI